MFSRDTTWTLANAEMYVSPFRCELALVSVRVLAQVMSVLSCERSVHGHIGSEEQDRIAPATTEKPVAAAACEDKLKMYVWDNE